MLDSVSYRAPACNISHRFLTAAFVVGNSLTGCLWHSSAPSTHYIPRAYTLHQTSERVLQHNIETPCLTGSSVCELIKVLSCLHEDVKTSATTGPKSYT